MSGPLALRWRPFHFPLPQPLVTARGVVVERCGWLLRLEAADGRLGWGEAAPLELGAAWAGASPAGAAAGVTAGSDPERPPAEAPHPPGTAHRACAAAIAALGPQAELAALEEALPWLPAPLAFAIGAALAELQGLVGEAAGGWGAAPASAWLLPAGEAMVPALEAWLASPDPCREVADPCGGMTRSVDGMAPGSGPAARPLAPAPPLGKPPATGTRAAAPQGGAAAADGPEQERSDLAAGPWVPDPWVEGHRAGGLRSSASPATRGAMEPGPTLKWKVAASDDRLERELLEHLLERLPADGRLRLDANGGWDRATAAGWADRLAGEPRLEWLEQPLAADDLEGLTALAERVPVALDESLALDPGLRERWTGWQVRRPALEGDPRPLLAALAAGRPHWMVSTAFETSIGRRLVDHAAALQWRGPTPTAPGLAPQWRPRGPLFSGDPATAWATLAEGER